MDEAQIRELVAAGRKDDSVTQVIAQSGPDILRFLLATARDEDLASDAFADWSERVWKSLPAFRWDCTLRSWLYRVAKTALYDQLRAERRKQQRQAPLQSEQIANVAAQVRTATLSLYRSENVDAMNKLRDSLDEDDRLLLVLRVDRELPFDEIAAVFLGEADAPALARETARLRKRFQLVKERLYELATAAGLIER